MQEQKEVYFIYYFFYTIRDFVCVQYSKIYSFLKTTFMVNNATPPVDPARFILQLLFLLAAIGLAFYGLGLIVHSSN